MPGAKFARSWYGERLGPPGSRASFQCVRANGRAAWFNRGVAGGWSCERRLPVGAGPDFGSRSKDGRAKVGARSGGGAEGDFAGRSGSESRKPKGFVGLFPQPTDGQDVWEFLAPASGRTCLSRRGPLPSSPPCTAKGQRMRNGSKSRGTNVWIAGGRVVLAWVGARLLDAAFLMWADLVRLAKFVAFPLVGPRSWRRD